MKNSIEVIWKEGFLNERSLVAPKINDLYNQRSNHLVARMKRMYKINVILLIIMAIGFPVMYYFLDAFWQGVAISILLLLTLYYSLREKRSINTLDYGVTSLEYLKSFDRWIKDTLTRSEKVLRFSYPLYFLIAMSTVWSAWNKSEKPILAMRQKFPDLIFIGNVPLLVLIIVVVVTLLMFYFSERIFRWDVGLMYGRIFRKLEQTIAEMEELKRDDPSGNQNL